MQKLLLLVFVFATITTPTFAQKINPAPAPANSDSKTKSDGDSVLANLIGLTGQPAPAFTELDMQGNQHDLASLRGKIVVLNLWGTFCSPCIEEMPDLNKLVDKYKNQDVVFLSAAADGKEVLEPFLKKHSFNYEILPQAGSIIKQYAPKKKVASPNDKPGGFVMLLPTHLVIDQNGMVIEHKWGYSPTTAAELSTVIETLLKK